MISHSTLLAVSDHLNKTRRCIAVGVTFNNSRLFSFNGVKNFGTYGNPKVIKAIKEILGDKSCYINDNYAFSIFDLKNPPMNFDLLETSFYENLYEQGTLFYSFTSYLTDKLQFYDPTIEKSWHRFFTCAEKKLYKYSDIYGLRLVNVYITSRPCFHCLPIIEDVYYLENSDFIHIRRKRVNFTDIFWVSKI